MVDELCNGSYQSYMAEEDDKHHNSNKNDHPAVVVVVENSSSTSGIRSPTSMVLRRTQSLPTSTATTVTTTTAPDETFRLSSNKSGGGVDGDRDEERLVVIPPTKSEEQYVDRFGFITERSKEGEDGHDKDDDDDKRTKNKNDPTKEMNRTNRRVQKWTIMVDNWSVLSVHRRKLIRRRLRKGLPDAQTRARVWPILVQLHNDNIDNNNGEPSGSTTTEPAPGQMSNTTTTLSTTTTRTNITYDTLWRNNDNPLVQDTIERDIHRTFPKHSMFTSRSTATTDNNKETATVDGLHAPGINNNNNNNSNQGNFDDNVYSDGQASLRRVLRAYSAYDTEIGYCQGMNFIAAMFLTILPEEQAFWMLVATMYEQPCCMRGLFAEGMRATHKVLYVADKLIRQFLPRIAKHLDHETIHVTMYATQWLLTVYTSSFPFELVTRVWDCFLFEGWKIVYRVMLALLQRGDLLKLRFEEILGRFREMTKFELSGIIETACKIPLKTRHIRKYEKEWTTLSNEQQVQQGSP